MKTLKQYQMNFIEVVALSTDSAFPVTGIQSYEGLYVDACAITHESMSQSWLLDTTSRMFEKNSLELNTVVVFKFGQEVQKDITGELEAMVLIALEHGIRVESEDGSYIEYNRLIRSASGLRGGGALMTSGDVVQRRKLLALGINEATLIRVVSKWESQLSLGITSSHPIPTAKEFVIKIVPDTQREISIKVKHLVEYDKLPAGANPCQFKGLDNIMYDVLSDKISKNGNPDIQFYIEEGTQTRKIELVDGTGIARTSVFDTIHDVLQMSKEEKKYCRSVQVRAPFVKGMVHEFGIDSWCDLHNITTLTDIYGDKFNPRDVDMILPESMFKGSNLFNHISEYYALLHETVSIDGVDMKMFTNNEWFRVANVNKKKSPMHEMTYQYIQAMLGISVSDTAEMAKEFVDVVRQGVTKDIAVAKKLLNLINTSFDMDDYNKSMVSKAQEYLELCPALFYSAFVQAQLIKCVETAFSNMAQGRIPMYGGYHFISGDVTLLLLDDSYRITNADGRVENRVILENEVVGLLTKGQTYLAETTGDYMLYRSPLIHPSEVVKASFVLSEELDKWFGHLIGIIFMNGYEPMALCMGGADYDGDKVYMINHPILLKAYVKYDYIIISPLENLKATTELVTKEAIFALDCRTMKNFTGIYTDMGTYYVNELYHTLHTYNNAIATIEAGCDVNALWDIKNTFFPTSTKLNWQNPDFTGQLLWSLKNRLQTLVTELDYKITIIRIAQAGEIDFPKHGTRFPMPLRVETDKTTLWLKPQKAEEDSHKPADKKRVIRLITPMQFLFDSVQGEWSKIIAESKANSKTVGTEQYLMGKNVDDCEFIRVLPIIRDVTVAYNNEIGELRLAVRNCDEDTKNAKFKTLYEKYITIVSEISADRQAVAKACVHVTFNEKSQNASMSFPFIVAHDGILMNLAQFDHQSIRIIPVKSLDHAEKEMVGIVNVLVAGKVGVYSIGGVATDVALPVELPVGEYNLMCVKGNHYVQLKYIMTKAQKDSIIAHYYANQIELDINKKSPVRHSIKAVRNISYEFVINGLTFNALDSEKAMHLIQNNNMMINFKEIEVKGIKQVGAFVLDTKLGVVARIDSYKVIENQIIDLSDFIGHSIKVESIALKEIYGKKGQVVSRIKVIAQIKSNTHSSYKLNAVHDRCDLTKWYWNVKWATFSELGFAMNGVDIITESPKVGSHLANVRLSYQGLPFIAKVSVVGGLKGIALESITNTMDNTQVPSETIAEELVACILRASSYFFAKKIYDEEETLTHDICEELSSAIDKMMLSIA